MPAAFAIARRAKELALRIALGASRGEVVRVVIVLGVGALASWIPIARALRIDPAMLLKTE